MGRPTTVDAAEIVRLTRRATLRNAAHWSSRTRAAPPVCEFGAHASRWRAHALKPHRIAPFKVSRGLRFAEC